jgi:YidC/Oxa1 family membrane protein insertase
MTSQIRVFLWIGFGLLLWLNIQAWTKDYESAAPVAPAAETKSPAAGNPQDGLSAELPAVTGEAAPAAAAATPPEAPAPGTMSAAVAGAGKVEIVTDVLDVEASLAGGELIRADIRQYPLHKNDPKTPVRLFNTDSAATQFLFQSGLTTGEAGRSEPNHKAAFTSAASKFVLADGQDTLEVPLAWTDGAGLSVTKTFVFRRGSYRVDLRYHVTNATAAPVKLASYAQLLRHSVGNKRSMWDPETYSFRGPAYYDGAKYQKLKIEDEDDAKLSRPVTNGWIAALQHHFVAAIVPSAGQAYQYELRVKDMDFLFRAVGPAQAVAANGTADFA